MLGPIGSENILLNLDRNQQNLGNLTSRLASGLRIQTAADDPSGLAISENFRSHIAGLQQSVENVQTGGNMLTVADGAAATIQQILQRIRSLIVESNSDINSNTQLEAIQAEIDQGLLEINRIAQNANFNGLKLFDGSHDTYVQPSGAQVVAVEENPGLLTVGGTPPTSDSVSNPQNTAPFTGQLFQLPSSTNAGLGNVITENAGQAFVGPVLLIGQITGFQANAVDPATGFALGGPGVLLQQTVYSTSTGFSNGNGNEGTITNAVGTGTGPNGGAGWGAPGSIALPNGQAINVNIPNLSPNDVGVGIAYELFLPQQSGGGTAININDGGQEGSTIAISLPTLNTNALQVSGISVLRPTETDLNTASPTFGQAIATDSSNQYAAMDAQIRVDNALDNVSTIRATIGAQLVSTQEDATNDNTAIVNFQATESSIRDLNVGTATTEFTREQILTSIGTSVLAQSEVSARQLTALLIGALVA